MKIERRQEARVRWWWPVPLLMAALLVTGCSRQEHVNMFEASTAQEALTELSKKFALPAKVLNIDLTPLSFTVRVQDPAQPSHVDEFTLEHSYLLQDRYHHISVSGPTPVQLNLINDKLEENLFNLADVNIPGTAATAKAAIERAALQDPARIDKVRIQRHLYLIPVATCGEVEWDMEVKSDREYATATANAKGQIIHMNLDGTNRAKNLNLYADSKELLGIVQVMREKLGTAPGILMLHLNRNFINFDARDLQRPKRLMNFNANLNGVLMAMDAFNGGPGATPLPDSRFFGVDDVDWSRVPDMVKQSQARLAIPNARLNSMNLRKPTLEGTAQPLRWVLDWRDGEGEDGEVEFDGKGEVTDVKLPKSRRVAVNACEPDGARQLMAGIKPTFGPHAKLIELGFSGSRVSIVARNPKTPAKVRDWMFEDDHFLDFPGMDQTPFYRALTDASFFDLDEIAAALPPKLAELEKAAIDRLKMPGGKVEKVTVTCQPKMQPPTAKVTVQIDVKGGDDKSGWVSYDLNGNVVHVMTP